VLFISTSLFHTGVGIGPGGWKAYASHYLFLQIYFPSQDLKGISAAWSLCVEMTFYLFIPLYAALLGRGRARRSEARTFRLELVGLGVLMAISFVWRFTVLQFQDHHSPYFRLATIWLPAYLDLFALGMGLAVVSAWMHHRGRETPWLGTWWFPWVSWAAALACFWGVSHIGSPILPVYFESDLDLARQTLYGVFAFFLLLPAVFGPQGRGLIRRFLQWWPMASLGVISYGIYLWHETWIYQILGPHNDHFRDFDLEFWAFFLAVLGLSIISSTLSYFVVEKPALRLKNSIAWWRRSGSGTEPVRTAPQPVPSSPSSPSSPSAPS
jgi:peptidoglycan/LPS O-acetylase OafA/YrhL